jgi:hypothetical protein
VFDHPTPAELTAELLRALDPAADPVTAAHDRVAELEELAAGITDAVDRAGVLARVRGLLERLHAEPGGPAAAELGDDASADDVFAFIDKELGLS